MRLPRLTLARLVLLATLLRVAYVLWLCPYSLVEDEAHYWEWSRRLDWSYYSKGPGVAWAIALSTSLLGDSTGAVRLPAVLFSGILAWAVGAMALRVTSDRRAGIIAGLLTLLIPAFQVASIIMTIDGPYLAFWALACLSAWDALTTERREGWARHWAMLGLWLALGFLFKYTILLLVPGILLGAFMTRRTRPRLGFAGPALAAAVAAIGLVPVILWNAERGWPTVHHLLGHLGLHSGDQPDSHPSFSPMSVLEFIATQIGVFGPAAGLLIAASIHAIRSSSPSRRFLLTASAPIIAFYLAVALVADAEANWALGGYVGLTALAGAFVVERGSKPGTKHLWRATLILGLVLALIGTRADLLARVPLIGRWIPVGRFMAAKVMARDADRRVAALRIPARPEPMVIAADYGRASQLAFHMRDHPVVFCASGWGGNGRKTQYSYWPDTDLDNPAFLGNDALLIGGDLARWAPAFELVEDAGQLQGESKKGRHVFVGRGYRGFGERSTAP